MTEGKSELSSCTLLELLCYLIKDRLTLVFKNQVDS
jgi:hypothetical protein